MTYPIGFAPLVDLERARAALAEHALDGLLGSSVDNVYYLTGHHDENPSFGSIPADPAKPAGLAYEHYTRFQHDEFPAWVPLQVPFGEFFVIGAPALDAPPAPDRVSALAAVLRAQGLERGRIGADLAGLSVEAAGRIADELPHVELVAADRLFETLRAHKSDEEIGRQRYAAISLASAIDDALAEVRPGTRETDIARAIRIRLAEAQLEARSLYVGAGDHGAHVVSLPTARRVAGGEVVRVDVVAAYHHYHADLSRNVAVGHASHEQRRLYRVRRAAIDVGIDAVRPGVVAAEVLARVQEFARDSGIADFRRHMVGHSIGLGLHEYPVLGDDDRATVPESAVFSIEAPYYRYDLAGFSPEDAILVSESGVERWTTAPAELPVVG